MFLIIGINQSEKQLDFFQTIVCRRCGRYGHISVWMRYTYFMLFFIPLFKWDKHYIAKLDCCGASCELDPALGREIERGERTSLDADDLHFDSPYGGTTVRRCAYCGYETAEDFQYCPKCGRPF